MKIKYNQEPLSYLETQDRKIASFVNKTNEEKNIDWKTVDSFGDEWTKFNSFSDEEIETIGKEYFEICDDSILNKSMTALDVGCGTGRWSRYVIPRAGFVEAIDPSHAVLAADTLIGHYDNVRITQAEVSNLPFPDNSFDFVFSLGVLHHIPDTPQAMKDCVKKLKPGGHFLVYLYYALDNRSTAFKMLFHLSNVLRVLVNKLPQTIKALVCDILAALIYLPLVSITRFFKYLSPSSSWWKKIPLSAYHNKSFNIMRNDSLDRFGTPLEQRFTKKEITSMMEESGLTDITFSPNVAFWHAVGRKK